MLSLKCTILCIVSVLGFCADLILAFQNDVEYDGVLTIRLEHDLNYKPNGEFNDRGSVNIQSIRTGAASIQQHALTPAEIDKLKKLSESDGLYRLRSFVRSSQGKETSFLSFVKACSLFQSGMSDILTVSLDHTGAPIAVSMATLPTLCEENYIPYSDRNRFNTTVFVRTMEQGPVPDTASYIQKIEREKEARDRGEVKDNRSFLAKYWMYIVPVVIFVVLSGAANPDGAAAGGGGGR